MDWGVFHVKREFLGYWRRYQRALSQRNAALRTAHAEELIHAWEQDFCAAGAEVDRLRNQPVSEAELAKAKTQIEANWYRAQDSAFYRGMQIGQYEIVGDWRRIDDYLPAIRKVTPADVQRAARRVFTEDSRTTAILVPTRPRKAAAAAPGHGGIR